MASHVRTPCFVIHKMRDMSERAILDFLVYAFLHNLSGVLSWRAKTLPFRCVAIAELTSRSYAWFDIFHHCVSFS